MALLAGLSMLTMLSVLNNERAQVDAYDPSLEMATNFEREILNARIFFIYQVTIQKPGALDKGWERYRNAEQQQKKLVDFANAQPELTELRPAVAQVDADLAAYRTALTATLEMVGRGELKGSGYDAQVKEWAAKGAALVADAGKVENQCAQLSRTSIRTTAESVRASLWRNGLICLAGLILCIVIAWLMVRQINTSLRSVTEGLRDGAQQVSSAASEVSDASQSLARESSEQAAMIEETSASAEEVNAMAKRNAQNSLKATEL
ncbi:MAG: hypothetical protein V4555_03415, partial [Acidobacteriota bacterium]